MKQLAHFIATSGKSRYQISKDTGINQTVLFRLVHGGSCNTDTLNKLCDYLGLELTKKRGSSKKKGTK